MMNLALIVLKSGQTLVSQSDELDYEPKVHLVNPYVVSGKTKITLTRWPEYTDDTHVLLRSDDLLTVCEPTELVIEAYCKKIGKKPEDFEVAEEEKEEQKMLLTEEEGSIRNNDDSYEPHYREEPDTSW